MKKAIRLPVLFAFLMPFVPVAGSAQTTFFADYFTNASTIDSYTLVPPTTNSTSYETISAKTWTPPSSITSGDLRFGIPSTSSGTTEIQALFATNAVVLTEPGDYIQLVITFTNTSGPLTTGQSYFGFGLYNSGGSTNYPIAGGLNGVATSSYATNVTGGVQNWQGYVAQVAYNGSASQIMTRPVQSTATANNDQDLVTSGSSSESYKYPADTVVGSSTTSSLILSAGATYTEVLSITLDMNNDLDITNTLYSGSNTNGTPLTQFGGITTSSTFLTAGFNAFAAGWYEKTSGPTNTMDISYISVSGQSTAVSAPPTITTEPVPVSVPNGGSAAFFVDASGFNVTYQWHRDGTNLVNGGNISGATSDMLVISPASSADVASGANGYYVTVSGAGNYSTNSTTNSLSLVTATNLVWAGTGSTWDLDTTADWYDPNSDQVVFNFGDPVTFNDVGGGGSVTLTGTYLSASSVTVDSDDTYTFQGSGSFAGPGSLIYTGPAQLTLNNVNTYTGGTLISNATAYVYLENLGALGSGPIVFGEAGGQMEVVPTGGTSSGLEGNLVVADDFSLLFDGTGSFGGVLLSDISGTSGKTLTLNIGPANSGSTITRIRAYGNATVDNANINLASSEILLASYSSAGSQTYNGVISGPGAFMEKGTITYFNGANTYSGGTTPAQGGIGFGIDSTGNPVVSGPIGTGPLLLAPDSTTTTTGSGMVFASGGAHTVANPIQYPTGTNNLTLILGGTNSLTLSGPLTLNGNDDVTVSTITNRTIQVTNTALSTLSGVISDGGLNYGLNVTGTGMLALNNTESYTGPTTVGGGTLLVNGELGSGSVTVTNGTLGGTGTVPGSVTLGAGGVISPGTQGIGTLNLSSSLTFGAGSTNWVAVNKTAGTHGEVIVGGSVTYGGTLYATNVSGTITTNDTFTIFSAGSESGNFTAVTGSPGSGLGWKFTPATGVLSVIATVNTNPTNITASVSGNTLSLSWPADHTGWRLLAQTNSLSTGLNTNANDWYTVSGSTSINQTNITINPTNGVVFYRLVYP